MSTPTYSILSIDGGGIRGIIPCMVLTEIERRSGKPIAELFDLIAGTSTGGILAGGLTITDADGKPKNPAKKLLELYTGDKGKEIFKSPPIGKLNYVKLLWKSLFPSKNIEQVLEAEFGDAWLSDTYKHTNLLITSYNTQEMTPFYFRSSEVRNAPKEGRERAVEDFLIRDIARATSAAPTYFPPKWLAYSGAFREKKLKDLALIDGGVFANNPSVLAYVEAVEMWKETPHYQSQFRAPIEAVVSGGKGMAATATPDNFAPPILLISLGTGQTRKTYPYAKIKGWGISWLMPVMNILMQGVSESVHYQMKYLLPDYHVEINGQPTKKSRYHRLNIEIAKEYSEMSDVSANTRKRLEQYGQELIDARSEEIDEIVKQLKNIAELRPVRDF